MTVQQIITRVDELRPNQYTNAQKIEWLAELDDIIWHEVVLTHAIPDGLDEYVPYTEDEMTATLLAPDRYCGLYEYWLYAKMDAANMEMDKYANDMALYNAYYSQYERAWNREHMPTQRVPAIYFGQVGWRHISESDFTRDPLEVTWP